MADHTISNAVVMDPVPRIEGHIGAEIASSANYSTGSSGVVTDVAVSVEMFRGFENILKGRHPGDALHITQRI